MSNLDLKSIELEDEKILLRPIRLSDCQQYYLNWLLDKNINCYLETRWERQSLETIRSYVQDILEDPNSFMFAIIEKETNQHIGNIKIGPVNWRHMKGDLSYFIGDHGAHNKGYAGAAIGLITRFCFNQLKLACIVAGVYASNKASRRVLEKNGFLLSGCLKHALCLGSGRDDQLFYAMTRFYTSPEKLTNFEKRVVYSPEGRC